MKREKLIRNLATFLSLLAIFGFLKLANSYTSAYIIQILNITAIYIILSTSYNLVNGVTGQFSLGPNAFMAVGAYTASLLTMSPAEKELTFIIEPIISPLGKISLPFLPSLLIAGVVTSIFAFFIAFPVFRVRGDYLAIVTLGFGEIIRVFATNAVSITNGSLGLKGINQYTNLWWSWGWAIFTVFCLISLVESSYGRAMKAIREDETAAQAMGINTFRYKMLAFIISAFFQGIGGGLLAHLLTTIDPKLFSFFLTFNLLIMIVAGGLGSMTGSIIGAVIFAWGFELLRWFEEPHQIGDMFIPGIPGMRMVIFSLLLIIIMLFFRRGITGRWEFSWDWALNTFGRRIKFREIN
ncbi:MAG: amino acid/amide ABC transporter membrane protein 2, HAAT family [Candidatus Dadabacteria bacterium CSP1-2]|nr:MAG: amino acid/amide ABC transporter membrane protein 2, HAAT family [Candidatus Dadabacteria bacterium CSP1-2]